MIENLLPGGAGFRGAAAEGVEQPRLLGEKLDLVGLRRRGDDLLLEVPEHRRERRATVLLASLKRVRRSRHRLGVEGEARVLDGSCVVAEEGLARDGELHVGARQAHRVYRLGGLERRDPGAEQVDERVGLRHVDGGPDRRGFRTAEPAHAPRARRQVGLARGRRGRLGKLRGCLQPLVRHARRREVERGRGSHRRHRPRRRRGSSLLGAGLGLRRHRRRSLLERQTLLLDVPALVGLGQEAVDGRVSVFVVVVDVRLVDQGSGGRPRLGRSARALRHGPSVAQKSCGFTPPMLAFMRMNA